MKTLVEKYACLLVYTSDILENCPEKWVTMHAAEISHDALTICRHQQMHCFLASVHGKWFPWEFTDGISRWKLPSLCSSAWVRFMGSSILKRVFNFFPYNDIHNDNSRPVFFFRVHNTTTTTTTFIGISMSRWHYRLLY